MNRFRTTTFAIAIAALLLPAAARSQAPPAAKAASPPAPEAIPPYETAQIDPLAWAGRFGGTNCAWFDMGDGVLLVDTGASAEDAKNLLAAAKKALPDKPVRWVVMTHLHPDSNNGFSALLPTEATLIVNQRALELVAALARAPKGKTPTVLGVTDRLVLVGKSQTVEIFATPSPAHTEYDLWIWVPGSRVAYVGDLVTPTRCPMASDSGADPKEWIATLDRIADLHPAAIVATRGPFTMTGLDELSLTRTYLTRLLEILGQMKAKGVAEARVSGEMALRKVGDYCPVELDTINALALFRRMTPEGTFPPVKPALPKPPAPKKK